MKYKLCSHCRASNQEHAANCFSCGKPMEEPQLDTVAAGVTPAVRRRLPYRMLLLLTIAVGALVGGWWYGRDDTNLRVEVTRLTNRGEGLIPPSQSLKPGDTLFVDLALRGWTPDAKKMCKGSMSMLVQGPFPLYFEHDYEAFEFPKRSRITHIPIETSVKIPDYMEPGDYTVKVKVRDDVAKKDAEFSHTFHIDAPLTGRDARAHTACARNVEAISYACLSYLGARQRMPRSLNDLCPDYFVEPPICPAAGKSTYRLLDEDRTEIFCEGTWHAAVRARPDHPRFSGRLMVDDDGEGGSMSGDTEKF